VKIVGLKNLKQYTADFLVLTFFCFLGFAFSEKPSLKLPPSQKKPFSSEKKMKTTEIKRHRLEINDIMNRNLFAVDGRYGDKIEKLPENPYSLVAIVIIEKEKRAILKDFRGQFFVAKEKEKMIDGYVIEKIGKNSVILKRGKQKKELRILSGKREGVK